MQEAEDASLFRPTLASSPCGFGSGVGRGGMAASERERFKAAADPVLWVGFSPPTQTCRTTYDGGLKPTLTCSSRLLIMLGFRAGYPWAENDANIKTSPFRNSSAVKPQP